MKRVCSCEYYISRELIQTKNLAAERSAIAERLGIQLENDKVIELKINH